MAAAALPTKATAPFADPNDGTSKDTVTTTYGNVDVDITFHLTGSVANVQADWATLIAVATLVSPSARVTWGGHQAI